MSKSTVRAGRHWSTSRRVAARGEAGAETCLELRHRWGRPRCEQPGVCVVAATAGLVPTEGIGAPWASTNVPEIKPDLPARGGDDVRKQYRSKPYTRLTQPMVREDGRLRPASWDEALDRRGRRFPPCGGGQGTGRGRDVLVLEGHQRDELHRPEVRPRPPSARTTSTPATALDTLLPSSVWRQSSEQAAARPPTARSRTPTSSSSGARTPGRPIRSSSTTSSPACATARACTASTPGAPARPGGPTSGSASTWAPTSRCPTRWPGRSSTPGWSTRPSSSGPRPASRSTRRRSRTGRWSGARR